MNAFTPDACIRIIELIYAENRLKAICSKARKTAIRRREKPENYKS